MTDNAATLADLEQHAIAAEIMRKATAHALTAAGSLDRPKASAYLRAAAVERHQHGDDRAAQLLEEWAEKMGEPMGDGE